MTLEEHINYLGEKVKEYENPFGLSPIGNPKYDISLLGYLKELETYKKALELLAKDYCESMGCSFCDHRAKCLESNHFEDVEGKEFLQKMFINEAREQNNEKERNENVQ